MTTAPLIEVADVQLEGIERVHLVGLGGSGISAIATVLRSMGIAVSGSDQNESAVLDRLRGEGVSVHVGHNAAHVDRANLVAVSTAIPATNPEVVAAEQAGIPVLRRADILGAIARQKRTLAVSGTHGKTTTTAMLSMMLRSAELKPSFIVGGDVHQLGTGAEWADGAHFVVEADESDGTFLHLGSYGSIVTNIEADHLDFYGDLDNLHAAFTRFVTETTGPVVLCADDATTAGLATLVPDALTYGTDSDARWHVTDIVIERAATTFAITADGIDLGRFMLPVPGAHLALNATAALALAVAVGADIEACRTALAEFGGVGRRFQFRGDHAGVTFVDDYPPLPTETETTLAAASEGGWGRVVAVFQPHRYSRTEALWPEFVDAFVSADLIAITDVYAAGESPRVTVDGTPVSGQLIVDAIRAAHPTAEPAWTPTRTALHDWLLATLRDGDLCMSLGAGDITGLADEMLPLLRERSSS